MDAVVSFAVDLGVNTNHTVVEHISPWIQHTLLEAGNRTFTFFFFCLVLHRKADTP